MAFGSNQLLAVVGYVRVSSNEQAAEGVSLEAQRARIESWCDATGAALLGVVEDAGVSGSRPLSERPGGREVEALLSSRSPEADAVVITRLDRLGRDAAENLACLRRFARGSVGLVSIIERLDLSTPQGRAMAGISSVFSELERELIGQRTTEALTRLREEGRVYGPVPYGYERSDGFLLPHSQELDVLRQIKGKRGSGLSFRAVADWLNRKAIPAKRGGSWSPMAVRSVCLTSARLTRPASRTRTNRRDAAHGQTDRSIPSPKGPRSRRTLAAHQKRTSSA